MIELSYGAVAIRRLCANCIFNFFRSPEQAHICGWSSSISIAVECVTTIEPNSHRKWWLVTFFFISPFLFVWPHALYAQSRFLIDSMLCANNLSLCFLLLWTYFAWHSHFVEWIIVMCCRTLVWCKIVRTHFKVLCRWIVSCGGLMWHGKHIGNS